MRRSAADSLRGCSTTSAPSAAWLTASAEASAPISAIPGFCKCRWEPRARAPSKRSRRWAKTSTNLTKQPITDDEIQRAKDAILNAFIFRLDSPDKILGERMTYEYYGYPPDWLDKYQAEIKKVTAADVNRVATKYLHKDQLAVLVVGNTKDFDKPLSSLGAVKEIDITIPPPPGAKEDSQTGRVQSGRQGPGRKSCRRHGRSAEAQVHQDHAREHRRERRRRSGVPGRCLSCPFPTACTWTCRFRRAR